MAFMLHDVVFVSKECDMFKNLNNNITKYYQFCFLLIITTTLCAIFYFWKLGFIDGSRGKALNKASFTYETLVEENLNKDLQKLTSQQNYKSSIERLEKFEKQATFINSILTHESFENQTKKINKVKEQIAKLISSPKTRKVLSVFNDKLIKFNSYVKDNKWRTLTRMSERVIGMTSGGVNSRDLDKVTKRVSNDFNQMISITKNSVLDDKDKAEIVSRVNNLQVEIDMLEKFITQKKKVFVTLTDLEEAQKTWFESIGPELSMQRLQVERMGRYYLMGMMGVLGLTSVLFMFGILLGKRFNRINQDRMESMIENMVNENILNQVDFTEEETYTDHFKAFTKQSADYINKRMSFGTIFQEALPFSSIMLDKNLKVDWANKQFSEDWKITQEEVTKDYMSWDYLNKLTNIGYDDPVLEALKHNVAGIYQIQIRPDQKSEVRPYEMFVRPVKYNNEKKIMLFFYPLTSIHDTIKDQARSIMNPIEKTVLNLRDGNFENLDLNQLRSEYEIGGIETMLDHFIDMDESLKVEKTQLTQKIGELYQTIEDLESIQDEILTLNAHSFRNSKGQIDYLKDFKEGVINLSSNAKNLNSLSDQLCLDLKQTFKNFEIKAKNLSTLSSSFMEVNNSLPNFDKVKEEIKDSKTTTLEAKSKLAHGLSDLVHFKKKISNPEAIKKFQDIYNKIANDFNGLDNELMQLSKKIIQIEIALSKTQMLFSNSSKTIDSIDSNFNANEIHYKEQQIKTFESQLREKRHTISDSEEKIIDSLQSIYKSFKSGVKFQSDMGRIITENHRENGKGAENTL